MKLLEETRCWSLLAITFSISLPRVFNKTIGRNAFGLSYDVLSGLGIMTVVETLKYLGQCPKLMQALAMLTILDRHLLFLRISFQWCHVILSGPGAEESTHLLMADTNSNLEKGVQVWRGLHSTLFKTLGLTCQWNIKVFCSIVLLNMLGKLIEKVISNRLQVHFIALNFIYLNQLGSIKQYLTINAGIFLTHLIEME